MDHEEDFRTTSPALDGITNENEKHNMPPPPHYMYCQTSAGLPADSDGLSNRMTDPSIYSQTTNIQQVSSSHMTAQDQMSGYYANQQQQWPTNGTNQVSAYGSNQQRRPTAGHQSSELYSPSIVNKQQTGDAAISEV